MDCSGETQVGAARPRPRRLLPLVRRVAVAVMTGQASVGQQEDSEGAKEAENHPEVRHLPEEKAAEILPAHMKKDQSRV